MPSFVLQTASMLGQSFIPMVFLVFGATCYTLILEHRKTLRKRIALSGCLLRLGVIPAILLLGAVVLPLPWVLKACLAIHAAVPAALIPIVIARHYHGDVATATTVSLSTIVVSLLTMPLWVQLGLSLIGNRA
jgi:predicted permease